MLKVINHVIRLTMHEKKMSVSECAKAMHLVMLVCASGGA